MKPTALPVLCFAFSLLAVSGCNRPAENSAAKAAPIAPAADAQKTETPKPVERVRVDARAIYMTGWSVGLKKRFEERLDLIRKTELNAMVIDVRDDGDHTYFIDHPIAKTSGANRKMVGDMSKVMARLKEEDIYPIARISVFRDTRTAVAHPELALQTKDGKPWRDPTGHGWLNPYDKRVWEYIAFIAEDAVAKGFKEIQFDYIRFPSEGGLKNIKIPGKTDMKPNEQVGKFMEYVSNRLKAKGVWVAADIFGLTGLVKHDMGIGQTIREVAKHVDYICPMVYPSHYAKPEYGIPDPERAPYKTVFVSLRDAKKRIEGLPCEVRPWLQDFSLGVKYGPEQVKAQIKATKDNKINGYMMWNAGNKYTSAAYPRENEKPAERTAQSEPKTKPANR